MSRDEVKNYTSGELKDMCNAVIITCSNIIQNNIGQKNMSPILKKEIRGEANKLINGLEKIRDGINDKKKEEFNEIATQIEGIQNIADNYLKKGKLPEGNTIVSRIFEFINEPQGKGSLLDYALEGSPATPVNGVEQTKPILMEPIDKNAKNYNPYYGNGISRENANLGQRTIALNPESLDHRENTSLTSNPTLN